MVVPETKSTRDHLKYVFSTNSSEDLLNFVHQDTGVRVLENGVDHGTTTMSKYKTGI